MSIPVRIDPVFGCHLFAGRLDRDGYGRVHGKLAHVVVWERDHGKVPDGYELDHVCRRRSCLRHLELVTRTENERRKSWKRRVRIKQCPKGHDMATAMVTPEGGRICRSCVYG